MRSTASLSESLYVRPQCGFRRQRKPHCGRDMEFFEGGTGETFLHKKVSPVNSSFSCLEHHSVQVSRQGPGRFHPDSQRLFPHVRRLHAKVYPRGRVMLPHAVCKPAINLDSPICMQAALAVKATKKPVMEIRYRAEAGPCNFFQLRDEPEDPH